MHPTRNNKKKLSNDRPSTSNNSFFLNKKTKLKRKEHVSAVDESSCSEDTDTFQGQILTTTRATSNNECSTNNVENSGTPGPAASFSRVNSRAITKNTTSENIHTAIQFEESSSSDSNELLGTLTNRLGSLKEICDLESDDSINQNEEPKLNLSWSNQNLKNSSNFCLEKVEFDTSSSDSANDGDSVYDVIRKKCKNPLNLFSTSDSSDSDILVRQQRFKKRKRINTSSEDSDDENTSVVQFQRRIKTNTRLQMTRQPRPKVCSVQRNTEESDSSSILRNGNILRNMRGEIETYRVTINIGPSSSSSGESLTEGLSSDDQLSRTHHSAPNVRSVETSNHTSRPSASGQQIIKRIRTLRDRDNELEAQGTSSPPERESETSVDENSYFNGLLRLRGPNNVSSRIQNHSDSSDSDSVSFFEPRRIRGGTVQIHYSDSDSNSEQTLQDVGNSSAARGSDLSPKPLLISLLHNETSSDSDDVSEKCPICFSHFGLKEVASPEPCNHSYCTKCIQEWAKTNNTCPVDRKSFSKIVVRSSVTGGVVRKIPVQSPLETSFAVFGQLFEEEDVDPIFSLTSSSEEEEEICCVCYSSNNSQNLILCDFCNKIYHMSCLTPPLRFLPVSDWCCPECAEFEMY